MRSASDEVFVDAVSVQSISPDVEDHVLVSKSSPTFVQVASSASVTEVVAMEADAGVVGRIDQSRDKTPRRDSPWSPELKPNIRSIPCMVIALPQPGVVSGRTC